MSPRPFNRNLTSRQEEVLDFVREVVEGGSAPPSYREIGEHFGIRSTNGVKVILDALERKGFLRRQANRARGIELTPLARERSNARIQALAIPLLGRVAAGDPILAAENLEGMVQVDSRMLHGEADFALEVRGDSMTDAGILDGDVVIARIQETALTGDLVVAVIGDEATVIFFFPDGGRVRLQPANERYKPLWVDRESADFRIAGKVVGLLRRF